MRRILAANAASRLAKFCNLRWRREVHAAPAHAVRRRLWSVCVGDYMGAGKACPYHQRISGGGHPGVCRSRNQLDRRVLTRDQPNYQAEETPLGSKDTKSKIVPPAGLGVPGPP